MNYLPILIAFVLAALFCGGLTPLAIRLAHLVGAIDIPNEARRIHKEPTPRLGGLAIAIGFFAAVLFSAPLTPELTGILLGAVVIVIMGAIDDIISLKALPRLFIQIAAAAIPVCFGVRVSFFANPNILSQTSYIHLDFWSIPITIFWIVSLTNAFNWIDGLDGLTVGVSTIASFSFLAIALMVSPFSATTLVMAALAGACIGFIPFNFNPARIFMGDCGAMFLGYVFAAMSVFGLFKFYAVISFAVPFLILGLPIFDMLHAIFRRVLRGKSPMESDRGHLHHRLIDLGLSQKQAVAFLYVLSGLCGISAIVLTSSGEKRAMYLLITIIAVVIATLVALKIFYMDNKK